MSLVQDQHGDYRIIEGVWEAAGFYTQIVFDVVSSMPNEGEFRRIKKCFRTLLVVSDIVCQKAGLYRYQLGSDNKHSTLSAGKLPGRKGLSSRVLVSLEELSTRDIILSDLAPFLLEANERKELTDQQIGGSYLDRHPLIKQTDKSFIVALPSAISVAARDFVIDFVIKNGFSNAFDSVLANKYKKIFYDTPLLGGPLRAPVLWKEINGYRMSVFGFEIDEGYFLSFHLFMNPISTHVDGGFKSLFYEEGKLTKELQDSIDSTLVRLPESPGFKEGIIVIVGCGWGKGHVTQTLKVDNPKWRVQTMSVADLIRLSWLADMKPSYFWRIKDGYEAIHKAGIHITNPNGILNLIGWVRENDGHFVPHADLPEGEISPRSPLNLSIPHNLLRKVRVESDTGYDRHKAIDNSGVWHDVQHVLPNPYFSSKSDKNLYASINEVKKGKLTYKRLSVLRTQEHSLGCGAWRKSDKRLLD